METLYELGLTYQTLNMLDWAKAAFTKFVEVSQRGGFLKETCEGYLELAICHRR